MLCKSPAIACQNVLNVVASYGVTAGAEAFASSVVSGVEGVVVSVHVNERHENTQRVLS